MSKLYTERLRRDSRVLPYGGGPSLLGRPVSDGVAGYTAAFFIDFDDETIGSYAGANSDWYRGTVQTDADEIYASSANLFDNRTFKAVTGAFSPLELLHPITVTLPRSGKVRVAAQFAYGLSGASAFRFGLSTGSPTTHPSGDYVRFFYSSATNPDTLYIEDKSVPGIIDSGTCGVNFLGDVFIWGRIEIDYDAETISVTVFRPSDQSVSSAISVAFPDAFENRVFDTLFFYHDPNNAYGACTVTGCWIGTDSDEWPDVT